MKKKIDNVKSLKGNNKKVFFYLFFTILFVSIIFLWTVYNNSGNYKIHYVTLRQSVQRCGKDFDKEIQTTRVFVEKFVNSYQNFIEKEINPEFKDSFTLAKGKNLSAIAIFSTVSEASLCIYPSNQNELIVECSQYPVQMSVFSGIEEENSMARLTVPYEEALKSYNNDGGMFHISVQTFISNLRLSSNYPKIFSFSKDSLVTLDNVTIEIRDSDEKTTRNVDIEGVGFITGEKDFSFAFGKAKELGGLVAKHQISTLFITSEFFRTALLDERLSTIAKEINQNCSRTEKDPTFTYPFWKFKEDVLELKEEAKRYGIDTDYIDDLLKYPSNQPKDGFLLWYYPDHFWFSVQWTIINTCLLILFVILIILKRKNNKIAVLINRLWPKLIVLLSVNVWVFTEKPKYMGIKYWIIPGVILTACFLLTVLKTKRR